MISNFLNRLTNSQYDVIRLYVRILYNYYLINNFSDEAGCHLRSVLYNGEHLCVPGNIASMLFIAHQTSKQSFNPDNSGSVVIPYDHQIELK